MNRWRVAVALCFSAVLCGAQGDPLQTAIENLQHGNAARAEQVLRAHLASHPKDADAEAVMAVVLDQEHKYEEAGTFFRRALAGDPKNAATLNNYGNHLLAEGKLDEAARTYRNVLAIDPKHSNALHQLARIAIKRNDSATAQQYLEKIVAADPNDSETLYQLGLAAARASHPQIAKQSLSRVLELQPENAAAMYDLAVVNRNLNQSEQALDLAARSCKFQPTNPEAHRLLAQLLLEQGYFADALTAWNDYLALNPRDEVAQRDRAFAQTAVGAESEIATPQLRKYAQSHPGDAMGHYQLALAIANQDPDGAKAELDRAIALNPQFASARVARGFWFTRRGEPAMALADFQVAAKQESDNPAILDRLAEARLAAGDVDPALSLLDRASRLAPDNATIALHLARALLKQGKTAEAEEVFARVRRLRAATPAAHNASGLLEFLKLSPDERMERYRAGVERAATLQPNNAEAQSRYVQLLSEGSSGTQLETACRNLAALKTDAAPVIDAVRAVLSSPRPSLSCASSLLVTGLQQHPTNTELSALQRVAAELARSNSDLSLNTGMHRSE